ncbi:hypothetical protein AWM75_04750 [Aerococcus urinaehominis]|uniref:Uncharacterized protein n=1 Tax=Aerococcus urinaehominis TaxID=128944 RepID=A0A0X8FL82_9LACT|nr:DUF1129 family protein [Aerococcus urinaehominis]AMB99350.1 hypothetical protein AWM75_04750 [Aerococcus urinaehominis]SDM58136.1 Uncharacterized membrane-anchored protein [Aerococcus urinaehominis]
MTEEQQVNGQAETQARQAKIKELYPQLTKRNADFMHQFNRYFDTQAYKGDGQLLELTMLEDLVAGQKEGRTAQQLYGQPSLYAQTVVQGSREQPAYQGNNPFWHYWLEGGLFIGGLFAAVSGITMLLNSGNNADQATGLVTLILNFIFGGLAIAVLTKFQPDTSKPKGQQGLGRYIGVAVVTLIVWIIFITGSAVLIPSTLNIQLPAFVYIAIAALSFVGRWWFKKEYNIKSSIF